MAHARLDFVRITINAALVDGGLLNPVPITPTLRDLTDCTIAVDVNAPPELRHDDPDVGDDVANKTNFGQTPLALASEDYAAATHWC